MGKELRREDPPYYQDKIRELQENVASLRMSRRILMSLLESLQDEQRREKKKQQAERASLKQANTRYARLLWEKNLRIHDLEKRLGEKSL